MNPLAASVVMLLLWGCGTYHATGIRAYTAPELDQGVSVLLTHEVRHPVSERASIEATAALGTIDKRRLPGTEHAGSITGCLRYGGELAGLICGTTWRVDGDGWSKGGEAVIAGASYRRGDHETLLTLTTANGPDAEEIVTAGYRYTWRHALIGVSAESHRWVDGTGSHAGARYPVFFGWRW